MKDRIARRSLLVGISALLLSGCFGRGGAVPTSQLSDAAAAIACTRAHWGEPWDKLVLDCWKEDAQAAADAVADIALLFQTQATAQGGGQAAADLYGAFPYAQEGSVRAAIERKKSVPKAARP
jgi:hypothetical protein